MKFWEAVKSMQEGKKVRLFTWSPNQYIYLNETTKIVDETGHLYGIDYISMENVWELYEEKREVDERLKQLFQILNEDNWFANNQYGEYIYDNNLVDHMTSLYMQLMEMAKYYKLD